MLCKRQTHPTNTMEQQQLLSKAHATLSKPCVCVCGGGGVVRMWNSRRERRSPLHPHPSTQDHVCLYKLTLR